MQITDESSAVKWQEFLQGDENAYSWLYKTYIQLLYSYGLHFTMDGELIKDCIQEVFTKIYKNRKTLLLPDNVRLYLLIALKNCLLNALNKQYRYTDLESIPFILSETVEDEFLSTEASKLQKEEVENILSILTPRQREIMYYRFVEEMDFDQICKIMDLNYNSAHNLIQRALKKVRDNYDSILFYLFILSYFSKNPGL
ncbi:sigma-70 family RNA polymerase sigma factor [Bacteroides sp. K03]|uniref:RNA polymerase sigma factor n=1 Tax=Bacteroides TaxID=816 RepID=UPI001C8C25DA|nr:MULTISPECIES: sigma-70 family RNA polymerase sigma factor [unclassified Bacteroides]MBX9189633.1 sigma-70 family RNA polymerase sigma factor [Bacteroides sp. K03]